MVFTLKITEFVDVVIVRNSKHNVSETGSFSSSGQGKETPNLLGPLETPNLYRWT
jgi:hypothetical protein